MFGQISSWLGVGERPTDDDASGENKENEAVPVATENENTQNNEQTGKSEEADSLEKKLDDVSAKAINAAKEWGSYLFDMGKDAAKTVTETAKTITKSMDEKTPIWSDFSREQDKFVTDKKEKTKGAEAAVPPWIGYNEEEAMKSQILSLSEDRRNFLRNPPAGVQFQFEFSTMEPVAKATLQEDPNLRKMRFELVPKLIKEDTFWRNYFYRVSLIKQSTQLTSLAQQTGSTGEARTMDSSQSSSSSTDTKGRSSPQSVPPQKTKEEDLPPESPPADNEFASDFGQDNGINEEDLRKEMQLLGVDEKQEEEKEAENLPQWERELQKELQEYEVVNESGDLDDADLENEILQEIEKEAKSL